MIAQLNELSEQIPVIAETYNGALSHIHHHTSHWPDGLHDRLDRFIVQSETYAANSAERMILSCKVLFDYALVAALIPFLVFYMVKDMSTMKRAAWYLTPPSFRKRGHAFVKAVDESLGDYIRGHACLFFNRGCKAAHCALAFSYPVSARSWHADRSNERDSVFWTDNWRSACHLYCVYHLSEIGHHRIDHSSGLCNF